MTPALKQRIGQLLHMAGLAVLGGIGIMSTSTLSSMSSCFVVFDDNFVALVAGGDDVEINGGANAICLHRKSSRSRRHRRSRRCGGKHGELLSSIHPTTSKVIMPKGLNFRISISDGGENWRFKWLAGVNPLRRQFLRTIAGPYASSRLMDVLKELTPETRELMKYIALNAAYITGQTPNIYIKNASNRACRSLYRMFQKFKSYADSGKVLAPLTVGTTDVYVDPLQCYLHICLTALNVKGRGVGGTHANFHGLFDSSSISEKAGTVKLGCLVHYLNTFPHMYEDEAERKIHFRIVKGTRHPGLEDTLDANPIQIPSFSRQSIQSHAGARVCFTSPTIGQETFESGVTQEDIVLLEHPELLAVQMLHPQLAPDEVVVVDNVLAFSECESLHFAAHHTPARRAYGAWILLDPPNKTIDDGGERRSNLTDQNQMMTKLDAAMKATDPGEYFVFGPWGFHNSLRMTLVASIEACSRFNRPSTYCFRKQYILSDLDSFARSLKNEHATAGDLRKAFIAGKYFTKRHTVKKTCVRVSRSAVCKTCYDFGECMHDFGRFMSHFS